MALEVDALAADPQVDLKTNLGTIRLAIVPGGVPDTKRDFCGATDIAFSPTGDGHLFVADGYCNGRVIEYDGAGKKITEWGKRGTGPGEFNLVHGIAFGPDGMLYASLVFSTVAKGTISALDTTAAETAPTGRLRRRDDGSGFRTERIVSPIVSSSKAFRPVDVSVGPDGALYACDWFNAVIGHYQASYADPSATAARSTW